MAFGRQVRLRVFANVIILIVTSLIYGQAWSAEQGKIDRHSLVTRHNPVNTKIDPLGPLTVGNGSFAFTADITGLQSFPAAYEAGIPLSTQSEWGWHSFPNPADYKLADTFVSYDTYGHPVPYASNAESEAGKWLRANPHRLGLARIGLELTKENGEKVALEEIERPLQKLDLWTGKLVSLFAVEGEMVHVETICNPNQDAIAVGISSKLLTQERLKVTIRFAYGEFGKAPEDWTKPDKHTTTLSYLHAHSQSDDLWARLQRKLDADSYIVDVACSTGAKLTEIERHHFELASPKSRVLKFVARFTATPSEEPIPTFLETQHAAAEHWKDFWETGGAIDLTGSKDPRAPELQRRIILSQYLMAIQCAGTMPPQETGLTFNSWFGKSHLEMHWWHAVQFALWNRLELLEKSLDWYAKILPKACETARLQGYQGARWPKMVGPEGRESPSTVGVFLIWQQPHPIYYAELGYRQKPTRATLEKYREVVYATADFMASYAHRDAATNRYVLGPPLIPAQEHYDPRTTFNPPFELEYWHWALGVARDWRARLGEEPDGNWDRVYNEISRLPITDGVYDTAEGQWITTDHPTHLAALGMLPGRLADVPVMRRTLDRVMKEWQWEKTWGWDYPLTAMTAARVGESEVAIDALLMDVPKNRYLANGHNHQDDRLPIYLPGNGGLLTAVAMMAAGWDGAPERHAPGFPDNGQWEVRWENLHRLP